MDRTVLTIDGQYTVCKPIIGQIPIGQPRHGKPMEPEDIQTVLTVCSPDGLLAASPYQTEDLPFQLAALRAVDGAAGPKATRMISSDKPTVVDDDRTFDEYTNLQSVSGEALHIAMRVEKAWGRKKRTSPDRFAAWSASSGVPPPVASSSTARGSRRSSRECRRWRI